jgi:hypothetical protein
VGRLLENSKDKMSALISLRQNFMRVADCVACDPRFQDKPSLLIEEQTFCEILEPVKAVFEKGRFYSQKKVLDVPELLEELRYMCRDAQTTHNTKDSCTRERRTELLNVLQSIKEKAEEGVDANGMRAADMDFFSLPELTDVIREAAMTHSEYLHHDDIAEALTVVAGNIESAQKRLWYPRALPVNNLAADDYYDLVEMNVA